jgi:cell division protein FtsB
MEEQHSSAPPLKSTRKLWLLFVFAFSGWIAYFAMFAATVVDRRDRNRRLESLQKQIDSLAKQADSLGAERQRRAAKGADKR